MILPRKIYLFSSLFSLISSLFSATLVGCPSFSASEMPMLGSGHCPLTPNYFLHPRGLSIVFSFRNAEFACGGFSTISSSLPSSYGTGGGRAWR